MSLTERVREHLAAHREARRLRAELDQVRAELALTRLVLAVVAHAHPNPPLRHVAIPAPRDPMDEVIRRAFRRPRSRP